MPAVNQHEYLVCFIVYVEGERIKETFFSSICNSEHQEDSGADPRPCQVMKQKDISNYTNLRKTEHHATLTLLHSSMSLCVAH